MTHDKALKDQPGRAAGNLAPSLPGRPAAGRELAAQEWPGHLPATQAALVHILMRASLGHDDFSLAERVFVHACELRSHVATGGWTRRIGSNWPELEMSRYILLALGAEVLSEDLARTAVQVKTSASRHRQEALLRHLENRMAAQGSMLDALLGRYAERLWSCRNFPSVSN